MAFDENKYKKIFEQRYGTGSFDSGLSQARDIGRLKVQASVAKTDYTARLKAAQKAATKKTYNDATSYWNDPLNKADLKNKGAYRKAEELKNDPAQQADIKAQGYNVSDYIDAMYNASSDGKYRSEREYNGFASDLAKTTKQENSARDKEYKSKYGMNYQDYYDMQQTNKKAQKKKDSQITGMDRFKNLLGIDLSSAKAKTLTKEKQVKKQPSNERTGFLGGLDSTFGRAGDQATRIFGDGFANSVNQNYANLAKDKLKNNPKDARGITALQQLNTIARAPKNGTEKAADFVGRSVGELAPYVLGGAYGGANGLISVMNPIKSIVAKDLLRGGIAGTIAGVEKAGLRKAASNEDSTLGQVGMEALMAGGGDAALGGLLRGLNLKGQTNQLYKGSQRFNEQDFQQGLQDAFGQKGNPVNVMADPKPSPFVPSHPNMKIPTKPIVEPTTNTNVPPTNKWFDFAQSGQGPQARGPQTANVGRYTKEGISNQGDAILQRSDALKNAPDVGYNQRLLDVQKEMQGAMDTVPRKDSGWLNFGQSSKYKPKSRPDLSPVEQSLDPMNRPQSYWKKRYEDFVKTVNNSYDTNRMTQEGLDQAWSQFAKYDEPVSLNQVVDLAYSNGPQTKLSNVSFNPEQKLKDLLAQKKPLKNTNINDLYQAVKQPGDPETFDELIKLAEMENNVANPPKGLKRLLDSNPRIKEGIRKLNALGGLPKKIGPFVPDKPNVKPLNELLNQLKKEPTMNMPNGSTLKMPNLGNGAGGALNISNSPIGKLQELLNANRTAEQGAMNINPKPLPLKPGGGTQTVKPYENISSAPTENDITAPNPEDGHGYGLIDLQAEANNVISDDLAKEIQGIKDIASPQVGTKNIYELADRLPKEIGDTIKTSLDTGKKNYVSQLEQLSNDLYENVVRKLGIKAGSKESKLVQDYGEKTIVKSYLRKQGIDPSKLTNEELAAINLEQLKKVYPNDWERIVEADQYFRDNYNKLIDQVNAVRKEIYPNSPDKIVPKRTDYYHHFNELEGFEGVKNLFDTPANIDPHLEGVSLYTKPKTKWQGFMQKRGIGPYKSDAVGGFLKYIKASSHSINIDPVIPVLRRTAKTLADATTESKNANKIIQSLEMNAGDLAGKTNPYDRLLQLGVGRKGERILNWVNSRVKGNMVLGNLSSALGQFGNVPLAIGKAKTNAVPGLMDTIGQTTKEIFHGEKTAPIYQSTFMKERYTDSLFRRFDQKLIQQPKKLAIWMMETADKAGTRFTWNSMYHKGIKEGAEDAVKYADYETRKLIAGRGVGEVPLLQKSKTAQIFMPFTLEVGNQWKVLRGMVGEKDAAGILTALIASYGLNKAIEQVRGSGVSFDPIDAIIDGYTRKDGTTGDKALNSVASLTGEVVGNIPGGNMLTQMVDTNKKVPLTNIQFKDLFGERNPNRFGSGLTIGKAAADPLYLLAPFGAAQFRKTTKGIDTAINSGVYKNRNGFVPFTGEKSQLQYPVNRNAINDLQLALMGPSSVSEARNYYNNKLRPLSEKQTNVYNQVPAEQQQEVYKTLMQQRSVQTIQDKIKVVQKDDSLTQAKKQVEILRLMNELSKIQQ